MSQSNRPALLITSILILGSTAILPSAAAGGGGRGSGAPQHFFGLAHLPRGAATLALDPLGRLQISNIGSSGNDGASITLSQAAAPGGESPGWSGEVDFGPAGALPAGASIFVQPRDEFDNPIASLHVFETGGGHAGVGAVADMCPTCSVTVEILLQGQVMRTAVFFPPLPTMLAMGNIGSEGNDGVTFSVDRRRVFTNQFDVDLSADLTSVIPITLNNGLPPTDGDELHVRLNGLPPGTRYIGNLTITADDTGPITVHDESLLKTSSTGKVKFFNEAKGFGYITGGGDLDDDGYPDIVVSNIGSSGNDGVDLRFRAATPGTIENTLTVQSIEADLGDAGDLPTGSSMKFIVGNDAPVVRTYALVVNEIGGGLASVSAIPCNEPGCCEPCCPCAGVVVEALHHGVLVDRVLHAALPTTVAVGNIGSSGNDGVTFFAALIDSCLNINEDRYLLGLRQYDPATITLTGSSIGAVTATTVRVRFSPSDALGTLGSPRLRASNMPQFTILDGGARPEFHNDLTHAGLPHDALGQASLSMTPDGSLLVANIGSSGNDGVAIALGAAHGVGLEIDIGPGGALPTGSYLSAGEPANDVNDVNKITIEETAGGQASVSLEQGSCPTCPLHVELLLDGDVVGSAIYPPPYPAHVVSGAIGSSGNDGVTLRSIRVPDAPVLYVEIHNPVATPMTLAGAGQTPVSAQCVRVTLNGLPPGLPADGVSLMQLTASGIPSFRVGEERTLNDYNITDSGPCPNLALGQATMCASRDNHLQGAVDVIQSLRVSNIGSSGNDGVRLDPPDEDCDGLADEAQEMSVTFTPIPLPVGAKHAINTKGTGAQGGLAGSTTFDDFLEIEVIDGVTQTITADFTSMGSTTHTVRVFNDGALVSSQSGVGPIVAGVPATALITKGGADIEFSQPFAGELGLSVSWVADIPITIPGQPPVVGDELRVSPLSPTMDAAAITSMSITGENLGEFTITDETIVPINDCPADIGGDGVVGVADLLAVIGSWGPCAAPCPPRCVADIAPTLAGDCNVGVADLLAVIGAWGACP